MLPVEDQFTDETGRRWEYRKGQYSHSVWCADFGKKTRNSNRDTWNYSLMIKGPISWDKVREVWNIYKTERAN